MPRLLNLINLIAFFYDKVTKVAVVDLFSRELDLPASAVDRARDQNFQVAGYVIDAVSEPLREPHIVRVGLIQNKIVLPTTDPLLKQVDCVCECHLKKFCFGSNLLSLHLTGRLRGQCCCV